MNVKFSGFFSVEATIHLLLHDLDDCTFKINPTYKNLLPSKSLQFHNITSKLLAPIPLIGDVVSTFRYFANVDIGCPLEGLQRQICKGVSNSFHDGKLGAIRYNLGCVF